MTKSKVRRELTLDGCCRRCTNYDGVQNSIIIISTCRDQGSDRGDVLYLDVVINELFYVRIKTGGAITKAHNNHCCELRNDEDVDVNKRQKRHQKNWQPAETEEEEMQKSFDLLARQIICVTLLCK